MTKAELENYIRRGSLLFEKTDSLLRGDQPSARDLLDGVLTSAVPR